MSKTLTDDDTEELTAELGPDVTLELPSAPGLQPVPTEGTVLGGRYLLEQRLGAGGAATVYSARDLKQEAAGAPDPRVAVKVVHADPRLVQIAGERLRREFHLARTLNHPNIVRVFDLDCDHGHWYMSMELLEGRTLAQLLQSGPVPTERARDILRQCSQALAFAHERGIVHGDLKPGNIFVTNDGEVRVLDFGAAADDDLARPHLPAASARYASPEVAGGLRPQVRDDVFSYACIAYELLNGKHPFGCATLSARARNLQPARAWSLTERQWYPLESALALERERRPESITALASALLDEAPLLPGTMPVTPEPFEPLYRPGRLQDDTFRRPVSPVTLIILLVILGLSAVFAYMQLQRNPDWSESLRQQASRTWERLSARTNEYRRRRAEERSSLATSDAQHAELLATPVLTTAIDPANAPATTPELQNVRPPPVASGPTQTDAIAGSPAGSSNADSGTLPSLAAATPALISFAIEKVIVNEAADAAVLTLSREGNLDGRVYVHWRVVDGQTTAGQDYVIPSGGRAEFADNQPLRAVYIPLLRDAVPEGPEEFFVELYDPSRGTRIWPVSRATVVIQDDD